MNDLEKTLKQSFEDREYRHGYVDEFLNSYIATQLKVLREQRGWSQAELAEHAGMMQPRISVMENVNYASWSVKILRKLAEAFDLTLCVSFESFGKRMEDIKRFGREALERTSFDDDPYFQAADEKLAVPNEMAMVDRTQHTEETFTRGTLNNLINLKRPVVTSQTISVQTVGVDTDKAVVNY